MPHSAKSLFRADAVGRKLTATPIYRDLDKVRGILSRWVDSLASKNIQKLNESQLLPDFLRDIFVDCLGYTTPAAATTGYTLRQQSLIEVDGQRPDAALGHFGATDRVVVVVEGKGPLDPLDRPFAGRKRSAVEQALQYAVQLQIDWYLVTNLREIRLYHKGHDTFTFERFELAALVASEKELKRFVFLLDAAHAAHAWALLFDAFSIGRNFLRCGALALDSNFLPTWGV